VDGEVALARSYAGTGLSGDGNSVAVERIALPPGIHRVEVSIGDGPDRAVFEHASTGEVDLRAGGRAVVLFDRLSGFTWAGHAGNHG
jgi:hypothetical protein